MIHIGDTKDGGERVELPVWHTGTFGQSGVGKTKLLKYMMSQANKEGFNVFIFDSKVTGSEFEGIGEELPFYLEAPLDPDAGAIDPDAFRSLIEGMRTDRQANMDRYRMAFIKICYGAKDFSDIGDSLKAKLANPKVRGYTEQMYSEISHDYHRLTKLLEKHPFSKELQLPASTPYIARMPTFKLPNLALQGLVVRSTVENMLRWAEKTIFLVDEAPNFVPQRGYNPAKATLQDLDEQGRKKELFGWYSGQTITGFDKANMKNLWYWIMGREMERNEAKDVYDTQTYKALTVDQVKQLKVREFIVSTPDYTKLVTVPHVDEAALFPQRNEPLVAMLPSVFRVERTEDWTEVETRIQEVEAKLA